MRIAFSRAVLLAIALGVFASDGAARPLEKLIAEYEAFHQAGDPEADARARGEDPRTWARVTPTFIAERAVEAVDMLDALNALDAKAATLESAILRHLLRHHINAQAYDTARIPFVGDWGFFAEPPFYALRTRANTREKAEAWIARLQDVPRYFDDHVTNLRRGIDTGWTQHADPLTTSIEQIRSQIRSDPRQSPLFTPFLSLDASDLTEAEIAALKTRGAMAVTTAIEAYQGLLQFLQDEYAPAARPGAGLSTLNGGRGAYAMAVDFHTAGAGYTPQDIHQIGQAEVARIRAEMDEIIDEVAFEQGFAAFIEFLRTDPQFYAETPDDLLEKAAEMSKRLDAILPRYFRTLPRLPYGVAAVPAEIAPGFTTGRYASGSAEKGLAGTYLVNTYALDQRPLYELPALSAHEAVPGHHLQIALAQELVGVPEFRKSYYPTAFGEGWALYAEKLAGEAGIYRTPYERFGQLSYEMWRACRLVADTGLHHYGWTRAEAATCFIENTALAPLNIETEVTRYIGWPGQATAYKIGELKILDLRARAKARLGEAFDIRDFHDAVLGAGAMPLDALDRRIEAWIAAREAEAG
ncbi:MAG: DUF885 domain-containing protein [Pseudomonadota bacterium]